MDVALGGDALAVLIVALVDALPVRVTAEAEKVLLAVGFITAGLEVVLDDSRILNMTRALSELMLPCFSRNARLVLIWEKMKLMASLLAVVAISRPRVFSIAVDQSAGGWLIQPGKSQVLTLVVDAASTQFAERELDK